MKKRAEMCANFYMTGKFDSEAAYKKINIECAEFHREGEVYREPAMKYKTDRWEINRKTRPTIYMSKELNKLCAIMEPKKEIIKQIIKENGLHTEFLIAIYAYGCQGPEMYCEKQAIDLAHYLNAEIGIDYYSMGDVEEEEEYDYEEDEN
ncbi:MAG TPA: DUF4279 domain-containing protein [Ignavibacteriales bacterium]|nr:DUF4279 domain-containing protein [Ignavibacteriales bacterium]